MKRILFLFFLLPYLASAQVAKDTVTVLTPAQITAASPNDTANIYFVIANAWRKANFDSIARYTRTRFQTLTLDSTHIAANGLNLQGTRFTGVLPVTRGGTGNTTGLAATATALATGRTIQTNLASTSSATFDGTANITPGVTGTLPVGNGGTGATSLTANKLLFGNGTSAIVAADSLHWDNSGYRLGIGTGSPAGIGSGFSGIDARGSSGGYLRFGVRNSTTQNGLFYCDSDELRFDVVGNVIGMAFVTGSARRMYISNEGFTGIGTGFSGTAEPSEVLDVNGSVRIRGLANAANPVAVEVNDDGVLIRGSSYEIKENINLIPYGLNQVMRLQPVQFTYKDKRKYGYGMDVGFIAQDANDIIPEAVGIGAEGDIYMDKTKIIPVLVKAIQEQQKQIEILKERITQLENK